jgi:cytochrome c6
MAREAQGMRTLTLWLGLLLPAALLLAPTALGDGSAEDAATSEAAEPDAAVLEAGRALFTEGAQPACGVCHTLADAQTEGTLGPNLDRLQPTFEQVVAAVTTGVGVMPAFEDRLTAEEIEAVAQYVASVAGGEAE